MKYIYLAVLLFLINPVSGMDLDNDKGSSPSEIISDTTIQDIPYVSARLLERLLESRGVYLYDRNKLLLTDPAGTIWRITPENPYLSIGTDIHNLIHPVIKGYEHFYLPVGPVLSLLEKNYDCRVSREQLTAGLEINQSCITSRTGPNILKIDHRKLGNGSIVDIYLRERLPYHTLWVAPHYIINLQHGFLSEELLIKREIKDIVKSISTIQEDSLAQITLYIPGKLDTVETSYSDEFNKLSLLIRKPVKRFEEKKKKDIATKTKTSPKTIIIDPGHGGKDPGAVFKGLYEKDIVLKIAKELKKNLKKKDFKVLLTRDTDKFIPLRDRPKFAAKHGGDLFISLHCNAIDGTPKKLKKVKGFVAYILRAGESEEDKALARRENKAVLMTKKKESKTQISPVEWILLEHELNLYSHQSELFAEKIVNNVKGLPIDKHRTGAHQAGFFVLAGTFMPAVLYEIGFITNSRDRNYMITKKGQKKIAEKLSKSIKDYFDSVPQN